jgi:uncharacterized protein (DUF433 family)
VQRHPGYISGALAMRSSPRMPVEALIVNYNDGLGIKEVAAMYEVLADEVRQIIRYAAGRS